ncbi:MAG TPA: DUF72 domain-containing protein [Candidatus Binataceae bacterium]
MNRATEFLVGTASWTDPTLVKSDSFYPPSLKTSEARLRFYAEQFATVEVDATYYTIVAENTARLWAARTPAGFVFNVKAFALLTQHAAETKRLPLPLRELLSAKQRAEPRVKAPPKELLSLAFRMFESSLDPLRQSRKLGMLVFQFPPYFTRRSANLDYIANLRNLLPADPIAIEFRHRSWLEEGQARADTMKFLRDHCFCYVSVDEPQAASTVPSFLGVSCDTAYVRLHGRNRENWFRRGIPTVERYKYLYAERELGKWADQLKQLRDVARAYVIFNNCYSNFGVMNATTMKQMLKG